MAQRTDFPGLRHASLQATRNRPIWARRVSATIRRLNIGDSLAACLRRKGTSHSWWRLSSATNVTRSTLTILGPTNLPKS